MTSAAEGLKAILEGEGVFAGNWYPRIGGLGTADWCVSLIDSGGRGGEVKVAIDYPSVQVLVRGSSSTGAYSATVAKAQEIYDTLMGIDTPRADWANLTSCVAISNPVWLGKDDKDRPQFSLNFRLIVTPENVGNRT